MEAGGAIGLAGCLQLVGISSARAVGSGGRVGEEILAVLDSSLGEKGTAVLAEGIVVIGNVREVTGEAELFVVSGVIANTGFAQPNGVERRDGADSGGITTVVRILILNDSGGGTGAFLASWQIVPPEVDGEAVCP